MDTILLKGIRAIDAENDFIADIYIADGKIKHVADSIEMKADIEIDGTGLAELHRMKSLLLFFRANRSGLQGHCHIFLHRKCGQGL